MGGLLEHQDLDQGLGQHFLITDTSGSLLPLKDSSSPSNSTPKAQRPSKSGSAAKPLSASGRLVRGTGDIPCENCGRMFSSHSNKERHKREHCHKFLPLGGRNQHQPSTQDRWQDRWQEQEEHPCPFPDCLETFVKSVHVKRHLTSNHGVANPLQWLEDQGEQVRKVMAGVVDLDEEERLEAGGERMIGMDFEEGNQDDDDEEEDGFDYNNSDVGGSAVDINNENSQGSFVDFEEKVPPLRIKLPSESSIKSPVNADISCNSKPEPFIDAPKRDVANVDSEEDDEVDDQLEIIDENTIGKGEEEEEPMIGVIINESSEDAQRKGEDRLADKDDLEETLLD